MSTSITEHYLDQQLMPFLEGEAGLGHAIGVGPDDVERIIKLGVSAFSVGQLDRAKKIFEAALLLDPNVYLTQFYLGLIAQQTGRHEEACTMLQIAGALIEQTPNPGTEQMEVYLDIIFLTGSSLMALGRHNDAATVFSALIGYGDHVDPSMLEDSQRYLEICLAGGVQ